METKLSKFLEDYKREVMQEVSVLMHTHQSDSLVDIQLLQKALNNKITWIKIINSIILSLENPTRSYRTMVNNIVTTRGDYLNEDFALDVFKFVKKIDLWMNEFYSIKN